MLHNNLISDAGNHGIHSLDGDTSTLSNNTVLSSANSGIMVSMSNPIIRDNIIVGGAIGINSSGTFPDSDYNTCWNNTMGSHVGCFPGPHDIVTDPMFVRGRYCCYYLSQIAAGESVTSTCVDSGSTTAALKNLTGYTTRSDDIGDEGQVDRGFHYPTSNPAIPCLSIPGLFILILLFLSVTRFPRHHSGKLL